MKHQLEEVRRDAASDEDGYSTDEHKAKRERVYPWIDITPTHKPFKPITITQLQQLVLYILSPNSNDPKWVKVQHVEKIRQVVVLMVPGLDVAMFNGCIPLNTRSQSPSPPPPDDSEAHADPSVDADAAAEQRYKQEYLNIEADDYKPVELKRHHLPRALQPLESVFPDIWPVRTAAHRSGSSIYSPIDSLLSVSIRPKGKSTRDEQKSDSKRTPVTEFLVTVSEQEDHLFVIHPAAYTDPDDQEDCARERKEKGKSSDDGWLDTKVNSLADGELPKDEVNEGDPTEGRHVLALCCAMVLDHNYVQTSARISVVDFNGELVMDELVKPDVPVIDYLTEYSGITKNMLEAVTTRIADIHKRLEEMIVPRTIIVGHSLHNHLNAIRLAHPLLVDTALLYPDFRGPSHTRSLNSLADEYLSPKGRLDEHDEHDSVRDARVCLELLKLKIENGPHWGVVDPISESLFKKLGRECDGIWGRGAVVDWGHASRGHGMFAHDVVRCKFDADVVRGIKEVVEAEEVGFVWGRLRELELVRGWWTASNASDDEAHRRQAAEILDGEGLGEAVEVAVGYILDVWRSLDRNSAFIVYSGSGDVLEMQRLQKAGSADQQALSKAVTTATQGLAFMAVK